jgi:hypothetical protein
MTHRKPISPKRLSLSHAREVDQMLEGIRGDGEEPLWTAAMRASIRGGKCTLLGVSIRETTD